MADISQTRLGCECQELQEGVRVTRHTSTSCPHQLDVITAAFLPSAATTPDSCFGVRSACSNCFSRSFNQPGWLFQGFAVLPVTPPNSSPVRYLLAADDFSIFHQHSICDVETNSSIPVTIKISYQWARQPGAQRNKAPYHYETVTLQGFRVFSLRDICKIHTWRGQAFNKRTATRKIKSHNNCGLHYRLVCLAGCLSK